MEPVLRKNYFYPDMPRNYQISQYDKPTNGNGYLDVELDDGTIFRVPIERAHIEDDAGKNTHVGGADGRIEGADHSLVDYNRAGRAADRDRHQADRGRGRTAARKSPGAYMRTLRDIVRALNISHARMEQGNMRADVNVSLRRNPTDPFGTRSETKNVNSFRGIEKTIQYEIRRQAAILNDGGEGAAGDPPLGRGLADHRRRARQVRRGRLPLLPGSGSGDACTSPRSTSSVWPRRCRRCRANAATACRASGASPTWRCATWSTPDALDLIEATVAAGASAAGARQKWWLGELSREANAKGVSLEELPVTPADVAEVEKLIADGKLNDKLAKQTVSGVLAGEGTPAEVVAKHGYQVVSDDGALVAAVQEAMAANPDVVEKLKAGNMKPMGAIIGAVMRATKGQADAKAVNKIVMERLHA